jgi:hypothetical protein
MADNKLTDRFATKVKEEPLADDAEPTVAEGKCGVIWPKGAKALDIERGGEPVATFQYVYLGVRADFSPTKFKVVFVGLQSWAVTVHGRNLRRLFDRLNDHCLRKLIQVDRDMGQDDGEAFVTRIDIDDVTPKDGE